MDGFIDGWMNLLINAWIFWLMYGFFDQCMYLLINVWIISWRDGFIDEWMDVFIHGLMNLLMYGWFYWWVNEFVRDRCIYWLMYVASTGDAEDCLLHARWLLVILARRRLSEKVSISTALFPPSFSFPLENVLPRFIGSTSQSPSCLVPVYFIVPLTCLPRCTVLSVHADRHARYIPTCFCSHDYMDIQMDGCMNLLMDLLMDGLINCPIVWFIDGLMDLFIDGLKYLQSVVLIDW